MSDTPPPITVRRATPRDLDEVTAVFAAAVWDEAVAAWMLPDEERRRAWGHATAFRRYLGAQIDDGALVVAGGAQIAGVSVWVPRRRIGPRRRSGRADDDRPDDLRTLRRSFRHGDDGDGPRPPVRVPLPLPRADGGLTEASRSW